MKSYTYLRKTPQGNQLSEPISNSTKLILQEAEQHQIKWETLPETKLLKLTHQHKVVYFHAQIPNQTSELSTYTCNNKSATNAILQQQGIAVPTQYFLRPDDTSEYLQRVFESLETPLVVKPLSGCQGDSITLGISTFEDFLQALQTAFEYTKGDEVGAVVEEQFAGKEYRILATREKVLGVIHRVPANVIGDGKFTLRQLIDQKNNDPRRGTSHTDGMGLMQIQTDDDLLQNIAEQNLTLESIIPEKKQIFLRKVSNASKGGDTYDYTDRVHQSVKECAMKAIQAIPGLVLGGIDFISTDITQPQTHDSYRIIEINSSPELDFHDYPYEGENRHVTREFLYLLFPELRTQHQ